MMLSERRNGAVASKVATSVVALFCCGILALPADALAEEDVPLVELQAARNRYVQMADFALAAETQGKVAARARRQFGADNWRTRVASECEERLARVSGMPEEQQRLYHRALMWRNEGQREYARNNVVAAIDFYKKAADGFEAVLGARGIDLAECQEGLANMTMESSGDLEYSEELLAKAAKTRAALLGDDTPQYGRNRWLLAQVLRKKGAAFEQVQPLFRRSLAIARQCCGRRSAEYAEAATEYAVALADEQVFAEAELLCDAVIRAIHSVGQRGHPLEGRCTLTLAKIHLALGETSEGMHALRGAEIIFDRLPPHLEPRSREEIARIRRDLATKQSTLK